MQITLSYNILVDEGDCCMNRYKQCRQALGMSQKFVALSVGVSPPMVSQWESGIKEPSKDTLVKLANLFNVTTDYLLFHDETTQKNQPTVSDDERRCQMPENRLKELREKFGLSQIELGNRLGVTQQSVFAWEHGKTSPQIQTAITLAQMYGVSLDYLLGLSDDPKIEKEPAVSDDELRAQTMERISALPKPVLLKLLELMDAIQSHPADGSAAPAAPGSSGTDGPAPRP